MLGMVRIMVGSNGGCRGNGESSFFGVDGSRDGFSDGRCSRGFRNSERICGDNCDGGWQGKLGEDVLKEKNEGVVVRQRCFCWHLF